MESKSDPRNSKTRPECGALPGLWIETEGLPLATNRYPDIIVRCWRQIKS